MAEAFTHAVLAAAESGEEQAIHRDDTDSRDGARLRRSKQPPKQHCVRGGRRHTSCARVKKTTVQQSGRALKAACVIDTGACNVIDTAGILYCKHLHCSTELKQDII